MKLTRSLTALALVMGLGAAPALAQEEVFNEYDADQSGFLTEEEFTGGVGGTDLFSEWDEDDDGQLTEEEYSGGLFAAFDDDGDGQLSQAEWDAGIDAWLGEQAVDLEWSAWDDDGSGALSQEEFVSQFTETTEAGGVGQFGQWDANQDSLISEDEFALGLFDWVDEDDDDQVPPEEFGLLNDVIDWGE